MEQPPKVANREPNNCYPSGALKSGGLKKKTLYSEMMPNNTPLKKAVVKEAI